MYEQIPNQILSFSKQALEASFKAQHLALENFERVAGLQLKTIEERMNATLAFFGEASEVRDADGAKAVWPKGVALVKESSEQFYSVGQEALNASLKASESIGQLVKTQLEAVNESVNKAAPAAKARAAK
jgi:hypothetical protein